MSKTVKFDVSKDSPISRSRKIMKKKKRIHFQFNIQRKFTLKTEPYMRALTLKGSNKVKVTFSSAGSSVVIRHKNVFANTRNVTKYAEQDGIKTSRFSRTWEHAQTACEITDQKGKSRPKNSQRLRRLVFEPAW